MLKPFPWPAEKLCTTYCVGVGRENMERICRGVEGGENLVEALEEISGVQAAGYEGDGTPYVNFILAPNEDNEYTHTKILEVIKRFISDD